MRPKLLDLFCGGGGAGMGYSRAGFDVVGVDHLPQPRYPFEFIQAGALEYVAEHGHEYDAIHASPPCLYYSRLRHLPWLRDRIYWRSIPPSRQALIATGRPWVLENVEDAGWDMPESITLCGQMFNLPLFRHRRWETPFLMLQPPHEKHHSVLAPGRASLSKRHAGQDGFKEINRRSIAGHIAGHIAGAKQAGFNMGIDWMKRDELTQAIPPAYTEYIGRALLKNAHRE